MTTAASGMMTASKVCRISRMVDAQRYEDRVNHVSWTVRSKQFTRSKWPSGGKTAMKYDSDQLQIIPKIPKHETETYKHKLNNAYILKPD
jgi:hypothetical protein